MKYAVDFRSIARTALKGKWGIAVVAGLIASLLGAIGSNGPELNVELNDGNFNASLQILGQDVVSSNAGFGPSLQASLPMLPSSPSSLVLLCLFSAVS